MSSIRSFISVAGATLFGGLLATHFAWSQGTASSADSQAKDRARIVLSQPLSKLDGDHLKVALVEAAYGPGEASSPHSHPCAVIGYVVAGALRTQVKGEPEAIYKAGESFYEPPNGVHLVWANASSTEPAKLVAYLLCDRDAPLSMNVSQSTHWKDLQNEQAGTGCLGTQAGRHQREIARRQLGTSGSRLRAHRAWRRVSFRSSFALRIVGQDHRPEALCEFRAIHGGG
jgi:quercetin dioxygenase-like cupin family protein